MFANEAEIQALAGVPHFETAVAAVQGKVETLVVTRSERGAIAVSNGVRAEVAAEPVAQVVDTTGAGDLFAAGFLAGISQGRSLEDSLRIGAIAAAEVISHYGARPEADIKAVSNGASSLERCRSGCDAPEVRDILAKASVRKPGWFKLIEPGERIGYEVILCHWEALGVSFRKIVADIRQWIREKAIHDDGNA